VCLLYCLLVGLFGWLDELSTVLAFVLVWFGLFWFGLCWVWFGLVCLLVRVLACLLICVFVGW